MNWSAVGFDWNHARGFLATVEQGSISAASRLLGVTQPTLSRQLSALESSLGVTLFARGHRSTVLTEAGLELLEHVRTMFEAATQVSLTASGQAQSIEGRVVITSTNMMATHHLPEILRKIRAVAPKIEIELAVSNEVQDLKKREADIAIRHARPSQPDLIAKKVAETTAHLVASHDYLRQRGTPSAPKELEDHDFIGFELPARVVAALKNFGVHLREEQIRVYTESGTAIAAMAAQGLGLTVGPRDVVERFDNLVMLDQAMTPIPLPVWLVTHKELHTSRRIRLVFDILAEELAERFAKFAASPV